MALKRSFDFREIGDDRRWLTVALEHGAKFSKRRDQMWIILDQKNTWMWHAFFLSVEAAARAYCTYYALSWPTTAASEEVRVNAKILYSQDGASFE